MPVPTDHPSHRTGLPPRELFPRTARLLRRGEFVRVQQAGKRVHTAHFILLMTPSVGQRLGVTVGRKVGGAVQRNRELFLPDCALVLVARSGADRLDYESVKGELLRAQQALARVRHQWLALGSNPTNAP